MLQSVKNLFFKDVPDTPVSTRSAGHASAAAPLSSWLGFAQSDGVVVSPKSSLSFSAVYGCVTLISGDLSTLPINVYKETDSGNIKQSRHPQAYLLKKQPSDLYNAVVYKRTLIANLLLWGNAYAKIHRNNSGEITSYEILKPWTVEPYVAKMQDGSKQLVYKSYSTSEILFSDEMIHLADLSMDGIKGYSKIQVARESVSLGINATSFGDTYYKNGAFMSGYLKLTKRLNPEGREKLRSDFISQYGGKKNAGSIGILEEDTEFHPFQYAMPMSDAQFLESRKFQVEEIARFYNVPPHKIGHLEKSSFNNIEQQNTEYVVNTLMPIAKLFEIEHDSKIFIDSEKIDHYVKIELKGLLRGDIKSRSEFYKTLMDRGVYSPNEVRSLEDMTPYEGGDVRMLPLNFIPVDQFTDVDRSSLKDNNK